MPQSEEHPKEKKEQTNDPVHSDMPVPPPTSTDDLKSLIEKNIKWSQVIYTQNRRIGSRLTLMVIGSYIRLLLIVIPIVFAVIYLPPLVKDVWNQYGNLFQGTGSPISSINVNDVLKQLGGSTTNLNISPDQLQQVIKSIQK